MKETIASFQLFLMHACLWVLVAMAVACIFVFCCKRFGWVNKQLGGQRALKCVMSIMAVVFMLYAGTKVRVGTITFDKHYIVDSGSYLTNDVLHLEFTKTSNLIPDDTEVLVHVRDFTDTNSTEYVQMFPVIAITNSPYEYHLENATNFDVIVTANYIPPQPVITNNLFQTGMKVPYGLNPTNEFQMLVPGSHFEDHAPAVPVPIARTSDGRCMIMEFTDEGSTNEYWFGYNWEAKGTGMFTGEEIPEGDWALGPAVLEVAGTNYVFATESYRQGNYMQVYYDDEKFPANGEYLDIVLKITATRDEDTEILIIPIPKLVVEIDEEDIQQGEEQ